MCLIIFKVVPCSREETGVSLLQPQTGVLTLLHSNQLSLIYESHNYFLNSMFFIFTKRSIKNSIHHLSRRLKIICNKNK